MTIRAAWGIVHAAVRFASVKLTPASRGGPGQDRWMVAVGSVMTAHFEVAQVREGVNLKGATGSCRAADPCGSSAPHFIDRLPW